MSHTPALTPAIRAAVAVAITPPPIQEEADILDIVQALFLVTTKLRSHLVDESEPHPIVLALAQRVEEALVDVSSEIEKVKPSPSEIAYLVEDAHTAIMDLWSYADKLNHLSVWNDNVSWLYIDAAMGYSNEAMHKVEK